MGKPLRVLIIEDSEDDTLLLLRELRRGGYDPSYERVDIPEAMSAALARQTWDVIISDYVMPRFSGIDALKLLQKSGFDLPFIIVSGKIGEDIAVEAMKAGAHDYITKGNLARLIPAIERELRDVQVRRERKKAEEELRLSELKKTILNRIANVFLTVPDERMYGEVLAVVLEVMESKFGLFGFIAENGDLVIPSMTRGIWSECQVPDKSIVFPPATWGDSLWGRAIREKKAFCSDGPFHTPEGHIHIDHFLVVSIVFGNETIGQISVANSDRSYTREDMDLLDSIANNIAPILNARLQRDRQEQERKRAEDALRENQARLDLALRSALMGVWHWDIIENRRYFDDQVCHLLGINPATFTGAAEEFFGAVHPDDRETIKAALARTIQQDVLYEPEYRAVWPDGSVHYITARGRLLRDDKGRPARINGIIWDITEHKKTEEIRLENERLAYANQAKSEFLASVSHDLRTPLNSIIGFSELLKQKMPGELNEKQEHFVDNVLSSSKHLLALIDDILDISKIEAGKMELAIEEISVPSVTDDVLTLIKEKAAKHKVILNKEFDPRLDVIEADKTKFKQILFNLLDNAVKFSKEEGGTVTITTKKTDDMAEISVSDTGIGIKEGDMGKLFTKFQQLEIGRKIGGTGLGLAISKQLVELHGGRIRAESRYGEGSTFTFLLPLKSKKEKR